MRRKLLCGCLTLGTFVLALLDHLCESDSIGCMWDLSFYELSSFVISFDIDNVG